MRTHRLLAGGEVVAAGAEGDASGEGAGAGSGVARFCAGDDRLAEASVAAGASFLPEDYEHTKTGADGSCTGRDALIV